MAVRLRRYVTRNLLKRKPARFVTYSITGLLVFMILLVLLGGDSFESAFDIDDSELKSLHQTAQDYDVDTSDYLERYRDHSLVKTLHNIIFEAKYAADKRVINDDQRLRTGQLGKPSYLVVEYTTVFDRQKFCPFFTDQSSLDDANGFYIRECPHKNCRFTCDKSEIQRADALLFHESDVNNEQRKDKTYISKISELRRKISDKIFILWNDEANRVSSKLDEIKFNWTMTYRFDAEVSDCAYGCVYQRKPTFKRKAFLKQLAVEFKRRSSRALWFVSNCQSVYRIEFASRIMDEFPIQAIGTCQRVVKYKRSLFSSLPIDSWLGILVFNFIRILSELLHVNEHCPRNSDCELRNLTESKLYLSYESKNCTNYITEKFWRMLRFNIIPVVIQPRRRFYEQIAPPDSFIHAEDFDYDPVRLARYLKTVASDFALYSKHLMWKTQYDTVFSAKQTESRRLCEMCTQLNEQPSTIYYESISNWFNNECIIN